MVFCSYVASFTSFSPFGVGNKCAFNSPSTAVLAGTTTICATQSANLTATITGGKSPYSVVYNDGSMNQTVNSYVSGANISVTPASTATYNLVTSSVTDASGCINTGALTGTPTVTVNPLNYNIVASGNWNTAATWSCGVPPSMADVTVGGGYAVTLNVAPTVNNLTLAGGSKITLGTNNLTVNGAITGADASNYIVTNSTGVLVQTPTAMTAKLFPIGSSASSYDPVTVTPANSVPFSISVKNSITNAVSTPTKTVTREWNIGASGQGATDLAFTPDNTALTVPNTPSGSVGTVGHWSGSSWDAISAAYASGTWAVTGYAGSFSPFVVGAADAVLAVDFTALSATNKGATNLVTFTTANEKDREGIRVLCG